MEETEASSMVIDNPELDAKRRKKKEKPDAVRYHCNYCRKDISDVIRIKCAQCADFDLCVECFSVGVEIGSHKNNHDYHVMDTLNFPLFEEDWGADEELLLLEGIEMYGFGNWGDVSDHVGTKGAQDCKKHYFDTYINVETAPLPDMSHILTTPESLQQRNSKMRNSDIELEEDVAAPVASGGGGNKKQEGALPPKPNAAFSQPEFAGYMPNRGDFETDYDNDAEMILTEMAFHDDDNPYDTSLKLKVIDIYNSKLDERLYRKWFIVQRNLFEYKKLKKGFGADRDIHDRMRCFARLLNKEDHLQFVQGVIAERTLRRRIEELKKYRRLGIRTLDDAAAYQNYQKGREERTVTRKSREQHTYYYGERRQEANLHSITAGTALAKERERQEKERNEAKLNGKPYHEEDPQLDQDLALAPGYDLLSDKERHLCLDLALFPQQYMLVKDSLLRQSLKTGSLDMDQARQLIKIDASKTNRIFDFLEKSGWINKEVIVSDVLPPLHHPSAMGAMGSSNQ
jgi:transcriptional adapter 2-alpha